MDQEGNVDGDIVNNCTDKKELKQNLKLKSLNSQVGGHQYDVQRHKSSYVGMYDPGNGTVLKALQLPPRGLRELNFYREVFNPECVDQDLLELKQFLPTFYGSEEVGNSTFLKLANLTAGLKKPCVADLKMGRITYDQDASPEKKCSEDAKFPPAKELGFKLSGIMIHDVDKPVHHGKSFCYSLTKDNIVSKGLGCFFSPLEEVCKKEVIQGLITKLRKIESWFLRQKKYSFIGTSLLIVYEGLNSCSFCKDSINHRDESSSETTSYATKDLTSDPSKKTSQTELLAATHSNSANELTIKCQENNVIDVFTNSKRSREVEDSKPIETLKRRRSYIDNQMHRSCQETNSSMGISDRSHFLTVHLIDFAHAFPADDIDYNVLLGVQKLICCLEEWLKSIRLSSK